MIKLTEDTANFKHFVLNVNHRCHPSIVNYASRLLVPQYQLIPHEEDIRVYRRLITGNLKNAAEVASSWITDWLENGKVAHACDIAVLAKRSLLK